MKWNPFKSFRKSKSINLSNEAKVEGLRGEVEEIFADFKIKYDQLDEVNNNLKQIIEEEEKEKQRLNDEYLVKLTKVDTNQTKARDELSMNERLRKKLEDFIV